MDTITIDEFLTFSERTQKIIKIDAMHRDFESVEDYLYCSDEMFAQTRRGDLLIAKTVYDAPADINIFVDEDDFEDYKKAYDRYLKFDYSKDGLMPLCEALRSFDKKVKEYESEHGPFVF